MRSRGVSDGSTVEVMSRMRGEGRHSDKKYKAKKKQAVSQVRLERKCDEERERERAPAIQQSKEEEKKQVTSAEVIQMMEKHEEYQKMIMSVAGGGETDAEKKL